MAVLNDCDCGHPAFIGCTKFGFLFRPAPESKFESRMSNVDQYMSSIPIQITRLIDGQFPGFVECTLMDAFGHEHRFVEKGPVVSREVLNEHTAYPKVGAIACEIEAAWLDADGRSLVLVSTQAPWGVESVEGQSQFVLVASVIENEPAV